MLMVYSMSGIFSKLAAGQPFLSFRFCLYYGVIIALLGLYAIGWQQIIKRMPLTSAYANRAVTVVWGIVWGAVLFGEAITWQKARNPSGWNWFRACRHTRVRSRSWSCISAITMPSP